MKKKILLIIGQWIISTILVIPVFSQNSNSIDLSGKWNVTWNDGNKGKNSVEDFIRFNPLLDSARYVETDVPLDLNLAMQKLGMFGDINFGTNTLLAGWVSKQYWQYYRFFNVPKEILSGTCWLVFDQLDYNATIYINGVFAGTHKNAFIPCRLDVTGKLKEGKNIITVGIESGLFDVADKEGGSYNNGLNTLLNKRHWQRKPQYQFSWDWNPNMINVGITGKVRVERKETVRLDNIVTWMKFNDDLSSAELTIRTFVQGLADKSKLTVEATLVETNQKVSIQDTLSKNTRPSPDTIKDYILPQYKRIINLVHAANKKFLLHSCGCIFDVMEDIVALGIDAKHSNEDQIAPFDKWIDSYNDRIGLFGGIDLNTLCLKKYDEVYIEVLEKGTEFRKKARGYGIGSGNSIPEYVPTDGFRAMVDAVKDIRRRELI